MSNVKKFSDLSEEDKITEGLERFASVTKAIDEDGTHDPLRDRTRIKVKCECGRKVVEDVLVDCRHLPTSQDWACDGCWTDWQRKRTPIDGGNEMAAGNRIQSRREWDRRWEMSHGSSQAVLDEIENRTSRARG